MLRSLLTISVLAPPAVWALDLHVRQATDIQSALIIDDSCGDGRSTILEAHEEAQKMVDEVLEVIWDNVTPLERYRLNWYGQAAIDYFGPPQRNSGWRENILRTLVLSSQGYSGWGLSEWWSDRRITVTCNDPAKLCGSSPAYTINDQNQKYPVINYCPLFFNSLSSHYDMWNRIQHGSADMKRNVRNLRSQATTALHELLHINSHWVSNACAGGCPDTAQFIGPNHDERVMTQKAGRAKLLARRDVKAASMTNDNYVYFVMARWMEKRTGVYPQYPISWDPSKSSTDNEAREDHQPGAPDADYAATWDFTDSISTESLDSSSVVNSDVYGSDVYPDWYKPVLDAMASGEIGSDVKEQNPPPVPMSVDVDPNSIVCETTGGSPLYMDCVNAFSFAEFGDIQIHHGKKDEDYWAAYVNTCAINIRYAEDWPDDCYATLGQMLDNGKSIFRKCNDGRIGDMGRCGGHVAIKDPKCPGTVQIIHTSMEG